MKNFVTSDTHFGHANIVKYCNRPFTTVEEMNEAMIKNWNDVVSSDDSVWFLGDFAFLKIEKIIEIFKRLNGTINFIPGNHDKEIIKWWKNLPLPGDINFLNGKVKILNKLVDIIIDETKYILCHYPLESWEDQRKGSIMLHGHSHGKYPNPENRFDVGIDVYGRPVLIGDDLKTPRGWK